VQKANQVFLPVLETASKADKLGTTLSIFERSKFFFNLPSFIMDATATVSEFAVPVLHIC
jgi:exocyst complex component 2